MRTTARIDYEQCVAYHRDGRSIADANAIERYLACNPRIAARAARDAEHDRALAHRYQPVLDEPIPPRLLHGRGYSVPSMRLAGAGLLAMIGLSVAGGWWLHGLNFTASSPGATPVTFNQQVARLADQEPNVDTATHSLNRSARPDLSRAGYQFSRRRIVGTGNQPLMAYDYNNASGQQVTIYARAEPGADTAMPSVISQAGVSLARWQSQGRDYALTGDLSPTTLNDLARIAVTPQGKVAENSRTPAAPSVKTAQQQTASSTVEQSIDHSAVERQPANGPY